MFKKLIFILLFAFCRLCQSETIEFVVTTSPGGPNDTVTRSLQYELEKKSNLKLVVYNKPGAGHNIGYKAVVDNNKPTLFVSSDTVITNKDKDGYPSEIIEQIEPIFVLGYFSNILFVPEKLNISNFNDLVKISKKRQLNFGHGGFGTYSHKSMEKICEKKLNCLGIPYKSGSLATLDLISGTIDSYSLVSFGSEQWMENTNLKPILLLSTTKHPKFNIETLKSNEKSLETKNWLMLFGKNISKEDKDTIIQVLTGLDDKYYTNMGLWYSFKNPNKIWTNSLQR
jgi:tripartite-type tricarboxylate transporter receptor subunit TctC